MPFNADNLMLFYLILAMILVAVALLAYADALNSRRGSSHKKQH